MDSKEKGRGREEDGLEKSEPGKGKIGLFEKIRKDLRRLMADESGEMILGSQNPRRDAQFGSLPRQWRKDRQKMLAEVERDGWNLQFASNKIRDDFEVAMAAVSRHGLALQWVSKRLRNDPEIVLAAVGQCGVALKFASRELRATWDIALAAVKQDGRAYWYIDDTELACDKEIIEASGKNFKHRKRERF